MPDKDRWSKLSMRDRANLIKIYTKHGVTDLNEIRRHYNSFQDPVFEDRSKPKADLYNRLVDEKDNRRVDFGNGNYGTHLMSSANVDNKPIVFSQIQPDDNSNLKDYGDKALDRAIERGDTIQFSNDDEARWWAENNYKQFYDKTSKAYDEYRREKLKEKYPFYNTEVMSVKANGGHLFGPGGNKSNQIRLATDEEFENNKQEFFNSNQQAQIRSVPGSRFNPDTNQWELPDDYILPTRMLKDVEISASKPDNIDSYRIAHAVATENAKDAARTRRGQEWVPETMLTFGAAPLIASYPLSFGLGLLGGEGVNAITKHEGYNNFGDAVGKLTGTPEYSDLYDWLNPGYVIGGYTGKITTPYINKYLNNIVDIVGEKANRKTYTPEQLENYFRVITNGDGSSVFDFLKDIALTKKVRSSNLYEWNSDRLPFFSKDKPYINPRKNEIVIRPKKGLEFINTDDIQGDLDIRNHIGYIPKEQNANRFIYEINGKQYEFKDLLKKYKKTINKEILKETKEIEKEYDNIIEHITQGDFNYVDLKKLQELRDRHFVLKAKNPIIDERSEPIPLYHGTPDNNWNIFEQRGGIGRSTNSGFYSTPNKNYASRYTAEDLRWQTPGNNPQIKELYGNGLLISEKDPKLVGFPATFLQHTTPEQISTIQKLGYDGIKSDNLFGKRAEVNLFKNNNYKLKDAITFDDNSMIIPLSKRDNFNISDLRFMLPLGIGIGTGIGVNAKNNQ